MAHGDNDFANRIADRLVAMGPVRSRRMFGGHGIFLDGTMFGLVWRDRLYFKTSEANRKAYEKAGSQFFTYDRGKKRVSMSYMTVPDKVQSNGTTLARWGEKALTVARERKKRKR
jgi:DNA transformation protein